MNRAVDIDHLSIRVSHLEASKTFYSQFFSFLGFKVLADYEDSIGWTNEKTRFWIGQATGKGRQHKHRIGDSGFHHYAFKLRRRKDVDDLFVALKKWVQKSLIRPMNTIKIITPPFFSILMA